MHSKSRIVRSALLLAILIGVGVVGYMLIEGWPFLDAIYMTVVTFTTVGYQEVHPLSSGGRVFTIFLMVGGVGTMLFILTLVVQTVVEGEVLKGFLWRRRMKTRLAGLNRHIILCGFGRVGREVSRTFQSEGVTFIVVDKSSQVIAEVDEMGLPYVQGDASDDETLLSAGIKAARGLVATVGSNSDNVFITLSVRALNPALTIVAKSTSPETEGKLLRAGANRVISPYALGGRRLALATIRPLLVDFFDTLFNAPKEGARLVEVEVTEGSPLAGAAIGQGDTLKNVQVLALKRRDDDILVSPGSDAIIEVGDALIVIGTDRQLEPLEGNE